MQYTIEIFLAQSSHLDARFVDVGTNAWGTQERLI